jgi:uncharacterized membrane protein
MMRYLIVVLVFFAIDMVWLGLIAKGFYAKSLGYLMAERVNWSAAIIFYLIFVFGLLIFVIQPALLSKSLSDLIPHAALFGLVTYATYDLTNLATIKSWPIKITIVDLTWGMVLSTSVSVISFYIISFI